MALRIQTQISGDVFIFLCDGRIVFGDEGAVLRERIGNMLPATPKIVVNLSGVDYIDSGGLGILVGLLVSARNRGANSSWSLPGSASRICFDAQIWTQYSGCTRTTTGRSQPSANR